MTTTGFSRSLITLRGGFGTASHVCQMPLQPQLEYDEYDDDDVDGDDDDAWF